MEDNIVYFYLPGIADLFEVNFILLKRMQEHPDHFYPNVRIGAIFGAIPGSKWNGGRLCKGWIKDEDLGKIYGFHWNSGVPLRWTWTNPCLDEEDLKDEYCNNLAKSFENGVNEVLVNNDLMENYIRTNYPKYPIISSTTKRITGIDALNEELEKDYKLVVIDYDFNNDWDMLKLITHPEKCEILVNPLCNPHCPYRKRHYEIIGLTQKGIDTHDEHVDHCTAQLRYIHEIKQLPTFVSKEDIWEKYVPAGFRHFKIEGRNICPAKPIEWYLYYLVKPEYQDEERGYLHMAMETYLKSPNIPIYMNKE